MVAIQMQFMRAMEFLQNLRDGEEGQGLVEYALIIALVSVALVLALTNLAGGIKGVFDEIITKF